MTEIREGTSNDIPKICELLIRTWKSCYVDFIPIEFLNKLDLERQIQRHTNYILNETTYYLVESAEGKLLGFCSYGKNRLKNVNCEKELYTLYVDKKFHGKGIGIALINEVIKKLEAVNHSLAVSVFEKNPFKTFYIKNGFEKIDTEIIDMGAFQLMGEIYVKTKDNP